VLRLRLGRQVAGRIERAFAESGLRGKSSSEKKSEQDD